MRIPPRMVSLAGAAVIFLSPLLSLGEETFRPVVRGKRGAVAAGHPLSAEAGMRLLQQGGNAVDAGCAAILAAAVVEFSHFSFGGEVPILVKLSNRPVAVVNGQGIAPRLATREYFLERAKKERGGSSGIPGVGILAATVPGVLDAVVTALDRYGTKSLGQAMRPAMELAEGFPIDELRVAAIEKTRKVLELWPTSAKVFLPNGQVPEVGEIFRQPDLARTLREIAAAEEAALSRGRHEALTAARDFFYKGEIAKRVSDFSVANGGLLRAEDFAAFFAKIDEPVHTTYRGYDVYKPGFFTQGPALIEMLNLLEGYDLSAMGHNSADYIHTVTEAMKLAFADRDRYYGDPDFSKIPAARLLSKEYAAQRRLLIDERHASLERRPGEAAGKPSASAKDTTCVNVIDKAGNLFSATPSGAWLPGVIAGDTGMMLSQRLQSFVLEKGHPNALEPGKRPRITLSPMLVTRDGESYLALSTPGGDNQDQALLQVFLNIVAFGKNVQEAVEAPRFQTLHLVNSFEGHHFAPGILIVEDRIAKKVLEDLAGRGHLVDVQAAWSNASAPTVIRFDAASGTMEAGADPRLGRYAVAW